MKWHQKGSEYFQTYQRLRQEIGQWKSVIIYGAAGPGLDLAKNLYTLTGCGVKAFIDRRADEFPCGCNGVPVYPVSRLLEIRNGEPILVTVSYYSAQIVAVILTGQGLEEWKDFYIVDKLHNLFEVYEKDFLRVGLIEIPITERCTFNCRKCSFMTPYYREHRDFSFDRLCEEFALLFQRFDFVETVRFLGGEPFLHPDFLRIIEHVDTHYHRQFSEICVLTNASLMPSDEFVRYLAERRYIYLGITDYTRTIPYQDRLHDVEARLSGAGVRYHIDRSKTWLDLGFPESAVSADDEVSGKRFFECAMHCRTLYDRKLWHCAFNSSAFRAGLIGVREDEDYLDLDRTADKKKIVTIQLGQGKGRRKHCRGRPPLRRRGH